MGMTYKNKYHQAVMGSATIMVHHTLCVRSQGAAMIEVPVPTMVQGWHQAGLVAHTSGLSCPWLELSTSSACMVEGVYLVRLAEA